MMQFRWALIVIAAACGGSAAAPPQAAKPEPPDTPEQAKRKALDKIFAEEPKVPYEVVSTQAFQTSRDCGQGPFRVEGTTLGAQYGEEILVYACTPHRLAGRSRMVVDGREDPTESFGYSPDNDRCRATDAEVAHVSDAGAATTTATSSTAPKSTATNATSATKVDAEHLKDATVPIADGKDCPAGQMTVHIEQHGFQSDFGAATQANRPFHVDIWSAEPNDLRGVTFVVRQQHVDPKMTIERWRELRKLREDWYAKVFAFQKSNDDMFVHEDGGVALAPPPPARTETQPPKPSVHADWVPGYYHPNAGGWMWIAGWWRVPDEDVKANLTVVAPTAPPPLRDESSVRAAADTRPPSNAVWADGHWQWDGARWVWVVGAWRLPPQQDVTWHGPTWRPRGSTFVFVPGGWMHR